jgi:metallo-beta-lactamase family protein
MATGGRILHHMTHRLPKANNTILFAGYQAEGSRGRSILDGEPTVRIFGEDVPVNCHVREIHGLSAHADQAELIRWLENFKRKPKMTFITHGELSSATTFSNLIREKFGWNTHLPEYLETFELFQGV